MTLNCMLCTSRSVADDAANPNPAFMVTAILDWHRNIASGTRSAWQAQESASHAAQPWRASLREEVLRILARTYIACLSLMNCYKYVQWNRLVGSCLQYGKTQGLHWTAELRATFQPEHAAMSAIHAFYDQTVLALQGCASQVADAAPLFFNWGLWDWHGQQHGDGLANSAGQYQAAARALVCATVELDEAAVRGAAVLDLACGFGGSTAVLREAYNAQRVVATTASSTQLASVRHVAQRTGQVRCVQAELPADVDEVVHAGQGAEVLICIDAAYHFDKACLFDIAQRVGVRRILVADIWAAESSAQPACSGWLAKLLVTLCPARCTRRTMQRAGVVHARGLWSAADVVRAAEAAGWQLTEVRDVTASVWPGWLAWAWHSRIPALLQAGQLWRAAQVLGAAAGAARLGAGDVARAVLWAAAPASSAAPTS